MITDLKAQHTDIDEIEIKADNIVARLINYGATLTHLSIDGFDVVLGFNDPQEYVSVGSKSNPYFGCIVGRVANRIKNGIIELDSSTIKLDCNNGPNALHGGIVGFDKRLWSVKDSGADFVTYSLISQSGDQGYPGEINIIVKYSISSNGLQIDYHAEWTNSAVNSNLTETVINLTNHSYFNLSNEENIKNHVCEMNADGFLEVDSNQIPTGKIIPIASEPTMDFTTFGPKTFGEGLPFVTQFRGYDHFFLRKESNFGMCAKVSGSNAGIELWTDAPGFQLYTGNWLDGSCKSKNGKTYGQYAGFCLEASYPPDSLNLKDWRDKVILKKGNIWKRRDLYRIFK